jgi:hypothetical protein
MVSAGVRLFDFGFYQQVGFGFFEDVVGQLIVAGLHFAGKLPVVDVVGN